MLKKVILVSINLFFSFGAFSVGVGDKITFIHRQILPNEKIHKSFFTYTIVDEDKENSKILKTLQFHEEGHEGYSYQYWYLKSEFPTEAEINDLLKNCENLGWKKDTIKVKTEPNKEEKVFDVCKTTKKLFETFPISADIFYYGHFPIYGVVKAEYSTHHPQNSTFYYDNLVTEKRVSK